MGFGLVVVLLITKDTSDNSYSFSFGKKVASRTASAYNGRPLRPSYGSVASRSFASVRRSTALVATPIVIRPINLSIVSRVIFPFSTGKLVGDE